MKKFLIFGFFVFSFFISLFSQNDTTIVHEDQNDNDKVIKGTSNCDVNLNSSAVTTIKSDGFNKGLIIYPQELITGKSPGLLIYPSTINAESSPILRVGGVSTISGNQEPLFIVDDVPVDGEFLNFLNTDDIDEMTVITDAYASALYGSQAVNGAVVIKTKSSEMNTKLHMNYHGCVSVSQVAKKLDVLSGDEIRRIIYDNEHDLYDQSYLNILGNENTDWQSELFRNAVSHNHHFGMSGGIKKLPYRVSVGYTDMNSVLKNTDSKRTSGTIALTPSFFKNSLKIKLLAFGTLSNNNLGETGALRSAYSMDPTQQIYDGNEDSDDYFQWENYGASLGTPNPVEQLLEADHKDKTKRYITDLMVDYQFPFLKGFGLNFSRKVISSDITGHDNRPVTSPGTLVYGSWGQLIDYSEIYKSQLTDAHISYKNYFENIKSRFKFTCGYSHQRFEDSTAYYKRSVTDEAHPYLLYDSISSSYSHSLVSQYGRIEFNFNNKYSLKTSLRREGSSTFSDENRWVLLPFLSAAWNINNEKFFQNLKSVSTLQIQFDWGKSGNNMVLGQYNFITPDISWEEVITKKIGINIGFLNNRIRGSFNYYHKRYDDLIQSVKINYNNPILMNVGKAEDKGVESLFELILISEQDIELLFGLNFTLNKNKVIQLDLSDENSEIIYGDAFTGQYLIVREGEPYMSFFVNQQVYDPDGNPIEGLYVDLSGEGGVVNGDNTDKYIYHSPYPDYFFGFSFDLKVYKFEFSASSHAQIGNYVYNQVAAGASYDQISQIGYVKNMPAYLRDTQFVNRQFTSDYFVQNASFLKIDHLTVAYDVFSKTNKKIKISTYLTAQNPFVFTKYKGPNPEIYGGIDNGSYLYAKSYLLGLKIGL